MKRIIALILVLGLLLLGSGCNAENLLDLLSRFRDRDNGSDTQDPNGTDPNDNDNGDNGDNTPVPKDDDIVLAAIVNGDLVLLDRLGQKHPVTNYGDIENLVWSPDGSKLLIQRMMGEILVVDPNDLSFDFVIDAVAMGQFGETPGYIWHPDNNQVALIMEGLPSITVVSLDQGTSRTINLPAVPKHGPWWNESGNALAFQSIEIPVDPDELDANWEEEDDYEEFYLRTYIFIVDTNGNEVFSKHSATNSHWVGDTLVYSTYEIDIWVGGYWTIGQEVVDSDGSNHRELNLEGLDSGFVGNPLPSGMLPISNARTLYVVDVDAGSKTQVSEQDYFVTYSSFEYPFLFFPAFHADWIATLELTITEADEDEATQVGYWDLVIHNLDTGLDWTVWSEIYLLDNFEFTIPHGCWWPINWSHDGQWLYVLQGEENNFNIWRVASDGQSDPQFWVDSKYVLSRPGY